jgi:hypothetical protein
MFKWRGPLDILWDGPFGYLIILWPKLKFGNMHGCFVVCLCMWLQFFIEDGVGGAMNENKLKTCLLIKHIFILQQFGFSFH